MHILVIGGTRNLGHYTTLDLLAAGHKVTLLNRGRTRDELPADIERLRADRTVPQQVEAVLAGREFDAVIDFTLYKGVEAKVVVDLLSGKTGHYIFLSTGQVYLVREGITPPFKESDYDGVVIPKPDESSYDYSEWLYGFDKREAEDFFAKAWHDEQFPYTTLRLPMVNSERDHFNRLYSYVLRIRDGGPILVPDAPAYPLRHVYGQDVARAIVQIVEQQQGIGKAYNLSQDETVSLEDFIALLGDYIGIKPRIEVVPRAVLAANGFLPDCSPFSERWMSQLDNALSKSELGVSYTPLRDYLGRIVTHYDENPPPTPASYRRRRAEQQLVEQQP